MDNWWKYERLIPLRFLMEEMAMDLLKTFTQKGLMPLYNWQLKMYRTSILQYKQNSNSCNQISQPVKKIIRPLWTTLSHIYPQRIHKRQLPSIIFILQTCTLEHSSSSKFITYNLTHLTLATFAVNVSHRQITYAKWPVLIKKILTAIFKYNLFSPTL